MANQTADALKAADIAAPESHRRNIRSTNVITVQERLETTRGSATTTTSRPPASRCHQFFRRVMGVGGVGGRWGAERTEGTQREISTRAPENVAIREGVDCL